mmetsp:Transcript_16724/g.20875  ORF Transcript_16724/g.20875 Transcript_16724/m.20875 type:complete len:105 (-) Transcript_16724:385-699(-)
MMRGSPNGPPRCIATEAIEYPRCKSIRLIPTSYLHINVLSMAVFCRSELDNPHSYMVPESSHMFKTGSALTAKRKLWMWGECTVEKWELMECPTIWILSERSAV